MGSPNLGICKLRPEQVREQMLLRLWTTADLCKRTGLERQTVLKALRGDAIQRLTAGKIAKAFSQEPVIEGLAQEIKKLDWDDLERERPDEESELEVAG
jgi:hypothetical protein